MTTTCRWAWVGAEPRGGRQGGLGKPESGGPQLTIVCPSRFTDRDTRTSRIQMAVVTEAARGMCDPHHPHIRPSTWNCPRSRISIQVLANAPHRRCALPLLNQSGRFVGACMRHWARAGMARLSHAERHL